MYSTRLARIVVAALFVCCVLCQVFVIPWLADGAVSTFPEAASLRQPVTVRAVSVVAAVEVGLLCLWLLAPLLKPDTGIRSRFLAYADVLTASLLAAAGLLWAILELTSSARMCPPAVALGLLAGIAGGFMAAVVAVIGRRRLKLELTLRQDPAHRASPAPGPVAGG